MNLRQVIHDSVEYSASLVSNIRNLTTSILDSDSLIEQCNCFGTEKPIRVLENSVDAIPQNAGSALLNQNDYCQTPQYISEAEKEDLKMSCQDVYQGGVASRRNSAIADHSISDQDIALENTRRRRASGSSSRRHSVASGSDLQNPKFASSKGKFASIIQQSRQDEAAVQARLNRSRQELLSMQYQKAPDLLIAGSGRNTRAAHRRSI